MHPVDIDPDELRDLTARRKSDDDLIDDLFGLGLEFKKGRTEGRRVRTRVRAGPPRSALRRGVARSILRYQYGDARSARSLAELVRNGRSKSGSRSPTSVRRAQSFRCRSGEALESNSAAGLTTMGRKRAKGRSGSRSDDDAQGTYRRDGGTRRPSIRRRTRRGPVRAARFRSEMTPADVLEQHQTGQIRRPRERV